MVGGSLVVGGGPKVEIVLPWQGQIWRLPYLEDGWFERVVDKNVCVKKGSCGWGKPCFEQGQAPGGACWRYELRCAFLCGTCGKALTGQMRASRIWQMNELNGLFFGDREDGSGRVQRVWR